MSEYTTSTIKASKAINSFATAPTIPSMPLNNNTTVLGQTGTGTSKVGSQKSLFPWFTEKFGTTPSASTKAGVTQAPALAGSKAGTGSGAVNSMTTPEAGTAGIVTKSAGTAEFAMPPPNTTSVSTTTSTTKTATIKPDVIDNSASVATAKSSAAKTGSLASKSATIPTIPETAAGNIKSGSATAKAGTSKSSFFSWFSNSPGTTKVSTATTKKSIVKSGVSKSSASKSGASAGTKSGLSGTDSANTLISKSGIAKITSSTAALGASIAGAAKTTSSAYIVIGDHAAFPLLAKSISSGTTLVTAAATHWLLPFIVSGLLLKKFYHEPTHNDSPPKPKLKPKEPAKNNAEQDDNESINSESQIKQTDLESSSKVVNPNEQVSDKINKKTIDVNKDKSIPKFNDHYHRLNNRVKNLKAVPKSTPNETKTTVTTHHSSPAANVSKNYDNTAGTAAADHNSVPKHVISSLFKNIKTQNSTDNPNQEIVSGTKAFQSEKILFNRLLEHTFRTTHYNNDRRTSPRIPVPKNVIESKWEDIDGNHAYGSVINVSHNGICFEAFNYTNKELKSVSFKWSNESVTIHAPVIVWYQNDRIAIRFNDDD